MRKKSKTYITNYTVILKSSIAKVSQNICIFTYLSTKYKNSFSEYRDRNKINNYWGIPLCYYENT